MGPLTSLLNTCWDIFWTSKSLLLTVRSTASFCSLSWPFNFWHIWTSGAWSRQGLVLAVCGSWSLAKRLVHLSALKRIGQDHSASAFERLWDQLVEGKDLTPSLEVVTFAQLLTHSAHTALAKSTHLWLSSQTQLFCSPSQEASSFESSRKGQRWLVIATHK